MNLKKLPSIVVVALFFTEIVRQPAFASVSVTIDSSAYGNFKLEPRKVPASFCPKNAPTTSEERDLQSYYGCNGEWNFFSLTNPPSASGFSLDHKMGGGHSGVTSINGNIIYDIFNEKGYLVAQCTFSAAGSGLFGSSWGLPESHDVGALRSCESVGTLMDNDDAMHITFPQKETSLVKPFYIAAGMIATATLTPFAFLASRAVSTHVAAAWNNQWLRYRENAFQENLAKYVIMDQVYRDFVKQHPEDKQTAEKLKKRLERYQTLTEKKGKNLFREVASKQGHLMNYFGSFDEAYLGEKKIKTWEGLLKSSLSNVDVASRLLKNNNINFNNKGLVLRMLTAMVEKERVVLLTDAERRKVLTEHVIDYDEKAKKVLGFDPKDSLAHEANAKADAGLRVIEVVKEDLKIDGMTDFQSLDLISEEFDGVKKNAADYEELKDSDSARAKESLFSSVSRTEKVLALGKVMAGQEIELAAVDSAGKPVLGPDGTPQIIKKTILDFEQKAQFEAGYSKAKTNRGKLGIDFPKVQGFFTLLTMTGIPFLFAVMSELDNVNPKFSARLDRFQPYTVENPGFCNEWDNSGCYSYSIKKYQDVYGSTLMATAENGLHFNSPIGWHRLVSMTFPLENRADDLEKRTHRILRSNNVTDYAACFNKGQGKSFLAVATQPVPGSKTEVGGLTIAEINSDGSVGNSTPAVLGNSLFPKQNVVHLSFLKIPESTSTLEKCSLIVSLEAADGSIVTKILQDTHANKAESDFTTIELAALDAFGNSYMVKFHDQKTLLKTYTSSFDPNNQETIERPDQFVDDFYSIAAVEPLPNGTVAVVAKGGVYFSNASGVFALAQDGVLNQFPLVDGNRKNTLFEVVLQKKPLQERRFADNVAVFIALAANNSHKNGLVVAEIGYDKDLSTSRIDKSERLFADEKVLDLKKDSSLGDKYTHEVRTEISNGNEVFFKTYHLYYDFVARKAVVREEPKKLVFVNSSINENQSYFADDEGGAKVIAFDPIEPITAKKIEIPEVVEEIVEIPSAYRVAYRTKPAVYLTDATGAHLEKLPGLENLAGDVVRILPVTDRNGLPHLVVAVNANDVGEGTFGVFIYRLSATGEYRSIFATEGFALFQSEGIKVTDVFVNEHNQLSVALEDFGLLHSFTDLAEYNEDTELSFELITD